MLWDWATFRTDLRARGFFLVALAFKWNLRIHDLKRTQEKLFLAEGIAGVKALGWGRTWHVWESEHRAMFLGERLTERQTERAV